MEMVGKVEKRFERALSHGIKMNDRMSGRNAKKLKSIESSVPYVTRDKIQIAWN